VRWRERISGSLTGELRDLAASLGWESAGERSVAVARGIYFRLPGDMPLWVRGAEFVADDVGRVREVLGD
jgi:hypothetical protein